VSNLGSTTEGLARGPHNTAGAASSVDREGGLIVPRSPLAAVALLIAAVLAGCGSAAPASTSGPSVGGAPSLGPSVVPSPSPSPSLTPSEPPSPTVTPSATPEPWQTYTSKLYRYTISYPPGWTVSPGDKTSFDGFDSFAEPRFYVGHHVESYTIDVADYIRQDIAYYKSKFKAKVVSNKPIKLASSYVGRIVEFLGDESGTKVGISHILVAKGKSYYELNFWIDDPATSAGRELFPEIYKSWRPTAA
jgi:hypothetical protein